MRRSVRATHAKAEAAAGVTVKAMKFPSSVHCLPGSEGLVWMHDYCRMGGLGWAWAWREIGVFEVHRQHGQDEVLAVRGSVWWGWTSDDRSQIYACMGHLIVVHIEPEVHSNVCYM